MDTHFAHGKALGKCKAVLLSNNCTGLKNFLIYAARPWVSADFHPTAVFHLIMCLGEKTHPFGVFVKTVEG